MSLNYLSIKQDPLFAQDSKSLEHIMIKYNQIQK
jgi:hypothetical protein